MHDYRYLAILTDDPDGGVNATFPDVPEAITFGGDRAETLRAAAEALGLALRGYMAVGRELPECAAKGDIMVSPHADDLLKIAFIEEFRRAGLSKEVFRDLSGLKSWQLDALLEPDHSDTVADLENALAVLGRKLRLVVEAA